MGVFVSNHSWSRTQTGALSSAGNMCVYIQWQLITNRQRQGLFPAQGPAPNWGAILVGTFELWAACEALLRRGTTTPPPTLLFLRTAFHTWGGGWAGWEQVFTWQKENIASWILNAIIAAHLVRFLGYHIKTSCKGHGNFEPLFHPSLRQYCAFARWIKHVSFTWRNLF